jgi:SAM-dependent methyltransferase
MFACRNCSARQSRPVYHELPDRFHGKPGSFDYVACLTCGLVQIQQTPAHLGDYYNGYRVHGSDSRIYNLLRRITIGHAYVEEPGNGRTLLDYGCGNGWYLAEMAANGWNVVGFEADAAHAAALSAELGVPVIADERELAARASSFDLVTLNFVFEHLDAPLRALELAARCLKPGGRLYLSVPNIESREAKLFKDRWFHLDPPRHLTFFTKALLRSALETHGFGEITVKDLAMPTGLAGSVSYKLWDRFEPLTWYALIIPGLVFTTIVRDGNFAISGRRAS